MRLVLEEDKCDAGYSLKRGWQSLEYSNLLVASPLLNQSLFTVAFMRKRVGWDKEFCLC